MTTQKPNTRKPRTTKTVKAVEESLESVKVLGEVEDVVTKEDAIIEEKPKKSIRKSIATIDLNDLVPVVALIDSVIFVADNTKAEYEWDSKGDVQYITYGELISMKGRQKRFLEEMWLYIDDEEVVEALNLTSLYEKYDEIKSIEDYLARIDDLHELNQVLTPLPSGIKKSLARQAAQLIPEKLDKYNTIKTLENSLGVELLHLLP